MIIRKMTASYGSINNQSLELSGGLNIICAPNESGKSTWCSFIQAMLYGIDTSQRKRAGYLPDKTKYAPWDGSAMEGSMDLLWRGREISLYRTGKSNTPMRDFTALYTGTGDRVEELSQGNPGEELTGVSQAVFQRSAFIRQLGLGVDNSPELQNKIASLVSTGEEEDSFHDADKRLRAWLRKRRHNQHGLLPQLEESMGECRDKIDQLKGASQERYELEEAIAQARDRQEELTRAVAQERKARRREVLEKLAQSQAAFGARQKERDLARELAAGRKDELSHGVFGVAPPEEVSGWVQEDAAQASRLREICDKKPTPAAALALLGLFVLSVPLSILLSFYLLAASALLLAAGSAAFLAYGKKKKAHQQAEAQLARLLEQYGAACPEGISDALSIHQQRWQAYRQALDSLANAEEKLAAAAREQKDLDKSLLEDLDFAAGDSNAARLGRELNQVAQELRSLRERRAALEGRLQTVGDPLVLETQLHSLTQRHRELSDQYESLDLAIQALGQANTEIQSRFSPLISRRASEYMSRLTGGEYDALAFDKELGSTSRRQGDTVGRSSDYMSVGALDQLYFALRLAICELALPQENPCPLILDDALVSFDQNRMSAALELLREISKKRQVILFTCHQRECRYFDGAEDVNLIIL